MNILEKNKKRFRKFITHYELYLFLLPALAYFIIFHYWPMYGLQIAFRNFNPIMGITNSPWVGIKYFVRFISGPSFVKLITNTLRISLGSLLLGFPIPILWALILNEVLFKRFKTLAQTVAYLPHFISTVVMASMITIFLRNEVGLINRLISFFGMESKPFMSVPDWFAWIYILSGIWQSTGWSSIIYLSSLSGVDPEQHESAMIDGASRLRRIWHINLPHLLPTITIMFILAVGRIMSVGFEKAFLLQNDLNLPQSEIISTYVYKVGLLQVQYSYSAAIGMFNSIINFVLLVGVNFVARKAGETSIW